MNACKPLTCEEARGTEASPRRVRVHWTHKGEETGGKPVSREEVTLRSIRSSYPRPLIAPSRRFRSCTGTSVLSVCPGSYSVVALAYAAFFKSAMRRCKCPPCSKLRFLLAWLVREQWPLSIDAPTQEFGSRLKAKIRHVALCSHVQFTG